MFFGDATHTNQMYARLRDFNANAARRKDQQEADALRDSLRDALARWAAASTAGRLGRDDIEQLTDACMPALVAALARAGQ
jgi:hypothetical protein